MNFLKELAAVFNNFEPETYKKETIYNVLYACYLLLKMGNELQ